MRAGKIRSRHSIRWVVLGWAMYLSMSDLYGQQYENAVFTYTNQDSSSYLTFAYSPPKRVVKESANFTALFFLNELNAKEPKAIEVPLQQEKTHWVGQLYLPKKVVSLMVVVQDSAGNVDSNGGLGYYMALKENDRFRSGARATIAYMYAGAWDAKLYRIEQQLTVARQLYEAEFADYPEVKRNYCRYYLSTIKQSNGAEIGKFKRELAAYGAYKDLSEWDLSTISNLYRAINDTANANLFNGRIFSEFSKGCWATQMNSLPLQKAFWKTDNFNEKKRIYDEFKGKFKDAADEDTRRYLELRKGITMLSRLLPHYEQYDMQGQWMIDVNELSDEFKVPTLAFGARSLNEAGKPELAERYAKQAVDMMIDYMGRPTRKITERLFYTDREVADIRQALLADYLHIYGTSLYRQNKHKEAVAVLAEAAITYGKSLDIAKNRLYLECLIKLKRFQEAAQVMKQFTALGKIDAQMADMMKELPIEKEITYDAGEIMKNHYAKKLKALLVDEQMPALTLRDAAGNEVALDAFRGKLVIVDCWASWCAPCLSGLAILQQFTANYRGKANFVVVGINTLERTNEARKRAAGIAERFTFVNLFDEKSVLPSLTRFSSLPTRLFIDKTGRLRLRQSGLEGNTDEQLAQLAAIVDLLD
ncbi:TlpA family protein disulfide reductase [Fibrella sp. WM1]|uniref:TlpA family protein disulfide reductase n=1 Tax=Fibrella musci TaxID=3242485 RepID=UPI0035208207